MRKMVVGNSEKRDLEKMRESLENPAKQYIGKFQGYLEILYTRDTVRNRRVPRNSAKTGRFTKSGVPGYSGKTGYQKHILVARKFRKKMKSGNKHVICEELKVPRNPQKKWTFEKFGGAWKLGKKKMRSQKDGTFEKHGRTYAEAPHSYLYMILIFDHVLHDSARGSDPLDLAIPRALSSEAHVKVV